MKVKRNVTVGMVPKRLGFPPSVPVKVPGYVFVLSVPGSSRRGWVETSRKEIHVSNLVKRK